MNQGVSPKKKFRKATSDGITKKGYATITFWKFFFFFFLNKAIRGSFNGLYLVFTGSNLVQFYAFLVLRTGEVSV
jgi:hypothetical protein